MVMYRQGDVLLIRVDSPAAGEAVPRDGGRIVLAYGEATGHAHAISAPEADLFETERGVRYLEVREPAELTHEEHAPIPLEPGVYEVRRQQEYPAGFIKD